MSNSLSKSVDAAKVSGRFQHYYSATLTWFKAVTYEIQETTVRIQIALVIIYPPPPPPPRHYGGGALWQTIPLAAFTYSYCPGRTNQHLDELLGIPGSSHSYTSRSFQRPVKCYIEWRRNERTWQIM